MQVLISNGINYDKDYWRLFVDSQWWGGKITHTLYQGAKFKEFYSYTAPVTRMCKTLLLCFPDSSHRWEGEDSVVLTATAQKHILCKNKMPFKSDISNFRVLKGMFY